MLVIPYHSFLQHPKRPSLIISSPCALSHAIAKDGRNFWGFILCRVPATPYLTPFCDSLSYFLDEPNLTITGNGHKITNSFPSDVLSRNGSLQVRNWSTVSLGHIVFSILLSKTLLEKHKPRILLSYMNLFIRKT